MVDDDFRAHLRRRLVESFVPAHLHEGLVEYIADRRPVGQLLTAVLSNNLRDAVAYADAESSAGLKAIVFFLFNYAPANCWGSPALVGAWLAGRRQRCSSDAQRTTMTAERRVQQIGRREVDLWREQQLAKCDELVKKLDLLVASWERFAHRGDAPAASPPYAHGHHDGENAAVQRAANEVILLLRDHGTPR